MMKTITNMTKSGLLGCFVSFALWAMSLVYADDTDIYLNTNVSNSDKPMIMLSIDYRSSLGNTACSDDEDVEADGPCGLLVQEEYLDDYAIRESGNYSSLEVYAAVLEKVMDHEVLADGTTVAESVLFGLMMSHNDTNCAPGETGCSNGGFILSGFRDLSDPVQHEFFFNALRSIPIPGLTENNVSSTNTSLCKDYGQNTGSHSYQGAELFFEFFRYLTGQEVYFGHTGYDDFGTSSNLNLDNSDDLLAAPYHQNDLTCRTSPAWDTTIEDSAGNYISPFLALDTEGCGADVYTFNFMFQVSQAEEDANCGILESRANGGMDGIAGTSSNCKVNTSEKSGTFGEVLKFLRDVDLGTDPDVPAGSYGTVPHLPGLQNVTSYFFVPEDKVNQTTNSYANSGGSTKAIGMDLTDAGEILEVIADLIEEVLTISTTFVSPTLPSNVFNRTDLLDQVYMSIFKADENRRPRWTGDLKRLHLNTDDPSNPFLAGVADDGGVSDESAISPDGRISPTTLTVWTHPEDVPAPPDPTTADYREGKDGRSTLYGGAGGGIPGYRLTYEPGLTNNTGATSESSNRIIYTEPDSRSDSVLRAFNADDATARSLLQIGGGGTTVATIDDDYKQIKIDLWRTLMPYTDCSSYDLDASPTPANCDNYNVAPSVDQDTAVARLLDVLAYGRGYVDFGGVKRDWFMGDPLHSKPVTINYGGATEATQVIRIAVSTNDGFLHFVRESDGVEEWAFSPRSVTGVMDRLQKNTLGSDPVHPYTMDGSPVVLKIDTNTDGTIQPDSDKVYLYAGMRRGGQHYYALDITDYEVPTMLWSINSDDPDFSELGQTWSTPQPIRVRYEESGVEVEKHALIFGGGYNGDHDGDGIDLGKDERDDDDPAFTGSDDDEGNAIFIVDAETGELIWKATGDIDVTSSSLGAHQYYYHANMVDSIPAEVLAVNVTTTSDNFHDRAYVGDTGGVIWRVDFTDTDPTNWQVTRLANLGRHDQPSSQIHDRRFYHGTDFVLSTDNFGAYDAVVVASGNRSNPLTTGITNNYLYVIKDRNTSSAPATDSPFIHNDLQDLTDNCLQDDDASDCTGFDSLTNTLPALEYGWKMKLEMCSDESKTGECGEKGLSRPLVLFGQIIFNSYIPPSSPDETQSCAPAEGNGQTYVIDLQDATAVDDLNSANNTGGEVVLDRSERLDSGGIPSDPVVAGQFGESQFTSGVGGGTCSESIGILFPDLDISLLCSIGLMKKYWYTTEPD